MLDVEFHSWLVAFHVLVINADSSVIHVGASLGPFDVVLSCESIRLHGPRRWVVSIHRMTIQLHHVITMLPVSCDLSDVPPHVYRTPRSGDISTVQPRSKLPHILHII